MGFFIWAIIIIALAVAVSIINKNIKKPILERSSASPNGISDRDKINLRDLKLAYTAVMAVLVVGFIANIGFRSSNIVQNGHIGIVKQFGAVVNTTGEGWVWILPWQELHPLSVKTEKITYVMSGVPNGRSVGSAVSSDSQPIDIVAIVNYQVQRENAVELYQKTGGDFVNRLIDPAVPQEIKAVTAKFKAIDFAANREKVRIQAEQALDKVLRRNSIIVNSISFANIGFSAEFNQAIEETQVAEQNAKRERAKVNVAIAQARQQVEIASGNAKAIALEGKALRNNPEVIKLRAIEKLNPNVKTIILPSDSNFLLPSSIVDEEAATAKK